MGILVFAMGNQPHIWKGLRRTHKPVTRPTVVGIPDLSDSIEGFNDLDLNGATQNSTEVKQFPSVEAFDSGCSLKIRRKGAECIPHMTDKLSLRAEQFLSLWLWVVHRHDVTSSAVTGYQQTGQSGAALPVPGSRGQVRQQRHSGRSQQPQLMQCIAHRTAPRWCRPHLRPP